MSRLIATFRLLQNEAIDIVSAVTEEHYHKQFHPRLKPHWLAPWALRFYRKLLDKKNNY